MAINSGLPPRVSIHGNRFGLTPYGLEVDGVQFGSSAAPSGTAWYVDAKVGQASAGGRHHGSDDFGAGGLVLGFYLTTDRSLT